MECTFPVRSVSLPYLLDCGARYWPKGSDAILALPVSEAPLPAATPVAMTEVELPEWARDLGVAGRLLIPTHCIAAPSAGPEFYQRVDWWQAAFLMLSCWEEADWERRHGPVHSYSYRLKNVDPRLWERAWVNRIFLLLRRWAARHCNADECTLFGALPQAEIVMTHDIDAISKTVPIRAKALAFDLFNATAFLRPGGARAFCDKTMEGIRFFFSGADYWCFPRIRELERAAR